MNTESSKREVPFGNGGYRYQTIFNIVSIIIAPIVLWMMLQVVDLTQFKAATEANRFTSEHGAKVWAKMADMEFKTTARMADMESNISKGVPPEWFLREVRALEKRLQIIEERHVPQGWHPLNE